MTNSVKEFFEEITGSKWIGNIWLRWYELYVIWTVAASIMDMVVCGIIFYSATYESLPTFSYKYVARLYDLTGLDPQLSYWLKVYGATSVSKLVTFWGAFLNPLFIIVIGSYLQYSSIGLNNHLDELCFGQSSNSSITCQVYNNPAQYQQLYTINQIQLFGSSVLLGLVSVFFIGLALCYGGYNLFYCFGNAGLSVYKGIVCIVANFFSYIHTIVVRTNEVFCCNCYTRFWAKFCYIFCYGTKPSNVEKNVNNDDESTDTVSEISMDNV